MAIHAFCPVCKTSCARDARVCTKCATPFGRKKRYRVTVSVKGKRVSMVVDNLTLAKETEEVLKEELVRGGLGIAGKTKPLPTLGDLWHNHYLPWAKEHKKSWRDDLRYYRRHLEPLFADRPLNAITPLDLERLKVGMKKSVNRRGKPYAPATIKHVLVIVRRLYNLARKWGLYDGKSPIEAVTLPRLNNQVTEYLTPEEAARLLAVLETWPCRQTAALVKFAMLTGLRRGELFKLTWQDVDLQRGLIALRDPKGGKTETLPVSPQALEVLQDLERTSEYVFPGKDGKQRVSFWRPWERIRKAAGLPENFRFHGLRHHYASTLVSAGVDLVAVQKLLTHKDYRTTQRYAHLAPGALREAVLKSGELLTPLVAAKRKKIN